MLDLQAQLLVREMCCGPTGTTASEGYLIGIVGGRPIAHLPVRVMLYLGDAKKLISFLSD